MHGNMTNCRYEHLQSSLVFIVHGKLITPIHHAPSKEIYNMNNGDHCHIPTTTAHFVGYRGSQGGLFKYIFISLSTLPLDVHVDW